MPPLLQDGDLNFLRGLNSSLPPESLEPGMYAWAENMWLRHGALETRPGFTWRANLPMGRLQGLTVFPSKRGEPPLLMAFVSGGIYVSEYPYQRFRDLPGPRLSPTAERVYAQATVQAVENNPDGSLRFIRPRILLILQDGESPALIYDGQRVVASTGPTGIPQGTHMAWAGNRLWVARREQIYASDLANPTAFTEQLHNTLGGVSYLLLPGPCTGLAVVPGHSPSIRSPLLAFTTNTTTMIRGNILDREQWFGTEDFQTVIFPSVGCVAPRSIVSYQGLLWWWSEQGVVHLDAVRASQQAGQRMLVDAEMSRSKAYLGDTSKIAAVAAHGVLLFSAPYGGTRNVHTWVLDTNPAASIGRVLPPLWVAVWTGVSPTQWVVFSYRGREYVFLASEDEDGMNRVYQAFGAPGRDNGVDVPWALETRAYSAATFAAKRFRFGECLLAGLVGQPTLRVSWAGGRRGRWKTLSRRMFRAGEGGIDASQIYGAGSQWTAFRPQSRVVRSADAADYVDDALASSGKDGRDLWWEADTEAVDTSFQLRLEGSGPVNVSWVRVFMEALPDIRSGDPDVPEQAERYVRQDGAASTDPAELRFPADGEEPFEYTAEVEAVWRHYGARASATVAGWVSQEDAEKRARQLAAARAAIWLQLTAEPYRHTVME